MSSLIAKQRLRDVIKQDRADVPCGRWVRVQRLRQPMTASGMALLAADPQRWGKIGGWLDSLDRTRYRYEIRR